MFSDFLSTHSSIQGALPILIDAALKGAILVAIAALAALVLRNRSAASRHAAWTAAVIGHLAIPALVLVLPAWKMPLIPAASWMPAESAAIKAAPTNSGTEANAPVIASKPVVGPAPTRSGNSSNPAPADRNSGSAVQSDARTSIPAATLQAAPKGGLVRVGTIQIIATIWLAGALLVLLRLAFGTWRVGQLARDGARVEDGKWLSLRTVCVSSASTRATITCCAMGPLLHFTPVSCLRWSARSACPATTEPRRLSPHWQWRVDPSSRDECSRSSILAWTDIH